jgi:hypothetical protein
MMLKRWFRDSETIAWARVQMFVGALWTLASQTDIAPILNTLGLGKYVPIALFVMGVLTEYLRRRRAPDLK